MLFILFKLNFKTMKTNYVVFLVVAAFLISACTAGVNKDLITGLKVSNSGLSYKEANLVVDNAKVTSSEFKLGDVVYLEVNGIEGYVEKDGKVFIGASLVITDPKGNKIMDYADLFAETAAEGVSPKDAPVITLHFPTDSLMLGAKCLWKSKIWDKSGKGEINTELEFTVK